MQSEFDKLEARIASTYVTKADAEANFVTWKTFTWVIGILMVIVIGLLGLIYSNQLSMAEKIAKQGEGIAALSSVSDFLGKLRIETQ